MSDLIYTGAEYALLQRPSIQLDGVIYSVELYWPSADDAASLAQKLADSGCAAVLGGLDYNACAAAAGTFREASLPMLSLASDDGKVTKANDLLFSAAPTAQAQGKALAKWALEQKLTQAALLTCVTDPYSVGVSDSFTQQLEAKKGKVLTTQPVTADQTDFTEVLNAIKKADAQVVCAPVGLEQGILLLNQAGELGLKVQWVSGDRRTVRLGQSSTCPARATGRGRRWAVTAMTCSWTPSPPPTPRTAPPSPKPSSAPTCRTACPALCPLTCTET